MFLFQTVGFNLLAILKQKSNGGTSRYERFVNLDHLADFSNAIVKTVEANRGSIALLGTRMDYSFNNFNFYLNMIQIHVIQTSIGRGYLILKIKNTFQKLKLRS